VLTLSSFPVQAQEIIASDTFDATLNRVNFTQNPAPSAFSSPGDGFETYQRGVSPSIPFALLDDTSSIFPADALGIIREDKTDRWFGITDTVNGDNPNGGFVAEWVFAISGFQDMSVSVDMGAMGDFETVDVFNWTFSIDGSSFQPLFTSTVDESASLTYTLASGSQFTLDDPLSMNGVVLNNNLATITAPVNGVGNQLTLRLAGQTDGNEAYAFDNIIVRGFAAGGAAAPEPGTLALLGVGTVFALVTRRRK
jgi:hypothetical protein